MSAAPVASITVSRTKPGPGGSTRRWRRPSISPTGNAIHQHGHRQHAAGDLHRQRGKPRFADAGCVDPRAVQRKLDAQRLFAAGPDQFACGTKPPQRQRQLGVARYQRAFRRLGQRRREFSGTREGIEQDWRRGGAADQARHRRAVGAPDPDADGDAAVESDRPRIAVAVGGAGLEGDPVMRGVLRRRRADQHIADLPGRDLIHQAQRFAHVVLPHDFAQRFCAAEPRDARIKLHQVQQA